MNDQPFPSGGLRFDNKTRTITYIPHLMNYMDHQTFYFKLVLEEENSVNVSSTYYFMIKLKGDKAKKYINAMKEAKHFISITRPFRCDPKNTKPDFCQNILKSEDACCMKFEYDEVEEYSKY